MTAKLNPYAAAPALMKEWQRTSIALTRPMAYHPGVQHEVSDMRIALDVCWGERLEAVPWTTQCIDCKRKEERG